MNISSERRPVFRPLPRSRDGVVDARKHPADWSLHAWATLLCVATSLLACSSHANENRLSYEIEAGYEFNDNVRLRQGAQEIEISGGKIAVPVNFESRTERFLGEIIGRVELSRFDQSEYDSDDQRLEGRARYKLERGNIQGYGLINRDTTRDSEFLDTGIVGLSASRREAFETGGEWDYLFTERHGLLAKIDYTDVTFEAERLQDFEFAEADLGWIFQASDRFRWEIAAHANRIETDEFFNNLSEGIGFKAGLRAETSERSRLKLLAGWISVDTEYDPEFNLNLSDTTTETYLIDANYRYEGERYDLTAAWISAPLPSGNGGFQTTDQLTLRYRYKLAERSRLIFDLVGGRRAILDERINNDRDYVRAGVRVEFGLSESLVLSGRYIYSRQDRENTPGTATSNEVRLSLVYRPRASIW